LSLSSSPAVSPSSLGGEGWGEGLPLSPFVLCSVHRNSAVSRESSSSAPDDYFPNLLKILSELDLSAIGSFNF
jgi:hypothetical protein